MSHFAWLNVGLKSLRICGGAITNIGQTRLASGSQQADPKPKRPLTPYFRFLEKMRPEIQKMNPELKAIEVAKIVGQKWSQLDSSSKQKYIDSFKTDMTSYSRILEQYNKSLSPEARDQIQQEKIEKQLRKEKREFRKKVRDLGKPKKPATAFLQYLMTKVKPGSGMEDYRSIAKQEGAKWKSMSDVEKQPWMDRYQKDSEKYNKELLKWEAQMLKQGNDELVRVKQLANATRKSK